MIRVTSLSNLRKLEDSFDVTWIIARSVKNQMKDILQVQDLSPSYALLRKFKTIEDQGLWNDKSFDEEYLPDFIKEMAASDSVVKRLNELCRMDKEGKNVCLLCFCKDERECHRSIIGGILQGVGRNVIFDDPNADYSRYYGMYQEERKKVLDKRKEEELER